jgi:hypothetical protein
MSFPSDDEPQYFSRITSHPTIPLQHKPTLENGHPRDLFLESAVAIQAVVNETSPGAMLNQALKPNFKPVEPKSKTVSLPAPSTQRYQSLVDEIENLKCVHSSLKQQFNRFELRV